MRHILLLQKIHKVAFYSWWQATRDLSNEKAFDRYLCAVCTICFFFSFAWSPFKSGWDRGENACEELWCRYLAYRANHPILSVPKCILWHLVLPPSSKLRKLDFLFRWKIVIQYMSNSHGPPSTSTAHEHLHKMTISHQHDDILVRRRRNSKACIRAEILWAKINDVLEGRRKRNRQSSSTIQRYQALGHEACRLLVNLAGEIDSADRRSRCKSQLSPRLAHTAFSLTQRRKRDESWAIIFHFSQRSPPVIISLFSRTSHWTRPPPWIACFDQFHFGSTDIPLGKFFDLHTCTELLTF